jgi:hypothetical protein
VRDGAHCDRGEPRHDILEAIGRIERYADRGRDVPALKQKSNGC